MTGGPRAPLGRTEIATIRHLASEGFCLLEIHQTTGHAKWSIQKHAGDILAPRLQAKCDARLARLRRLVEASDGAICADDRDAVARRFGLKDQRVLSVKVAQAKRVLGLPIKSRHDSSNVPVVGAEERSAMRARAARGENTSMVAAGLGRSRSTVWRHCADIYRQHAEARA